MKILYHTFDYFNSKVVQEIPSKWRKRVTFGFLALSIKRLESLNSNARVIEQKRKTAETKIYRVTHTEYFEQMFPELLVKLDLINKEDILVVDFSDFNGRQVLMIAKQTRKGRSIPLYFDFIRYPIEKGSQNTFIITLLKQFLERIKIPVRLVFDRGFAIPSLVEYLMGAKQVAAFYIRIKKGKQAEYNQVTKSVSKQHKRESTVTIYGYCLRIIRSKRNQENTEPWFIVTNDLRTEKEEVVEIYYYRFEIEEFFKDMKWIAYVEFFKNVKDKTFKIVLWFLIMGLWVGWHVKEIREA